VHHGAAQVHFLLLLVEPGRLADRLDPFLGVLRGRGLKVVVARGREEPKEVLALVLGVLEGGDGGEVRGVDLVAELGLLVVLVYGDAVWSQDEVDALPVLSFAAQSALASL
jgi:hypothetical protein